MSQILLPVGRLVWGSLYEPKTKDFNGNPLVIKIGPNAGQPTQKYGFGVAVPKRGEQHWSQTEWGQKIWAEGHTGYPQGVPRDFAWKIKDGDSQELNTSNVPFNQVVGNAGHWIVSCGSSYPPKLYRITGPKQIEVAAEPNAIKPGYWVEVLIDTVPNNDRAKPGVFINHNMVCLAGYDTVINTGIDPASVGFGGGQLPPGVSATPIGGFAPPAPAGYPAPQGYAPPPPVPGQVPYGAGGQPGHPAPPAQYQAPGGYAPPPPPAPAAAPVYQAPPAHYPAAAPAGYPPPPAPHGAPPAGVAPVPGFLNGPAPQPYAAPAGYAPAPGAYPPPAGYAPR